MSLLREIQNAAIDSKIELAVLLRKCKVLAARLKNPEFKQWVENEISGYKSSESLPDYRIFKVNSKGHFSGPFQSGLRNADIPLSCIDKEFHEFLSHAYFTQPVASMESLLDDAQGNLQEPWHPDIVALFGQQIYEGMNCMQAWKVIPRGAVVATLDAVRNRILNFALELEAEFPDVGEESNDENPLKEQKIHHIFNTYITGNVQNMATGSTNVNQKAISNSTDIELFKNLLDALHKSEGDKHIKSELTNTVEEMQASQSNSRLFRENYCKFMTILADHMQVFGPIVAPFLAQLASKIS